MPTPHLLVMPRRARSARFNVYSQEDIDGLVSDDEWLPRYREAVTLMLAAWGWDAEGRTMVTDAGRDQGWSNWDVRLAKVNGRVSLPV